MGPLLRDLRFGLRMLARNPGISTIAIVTLALAISANTTVFSWINATVLDPIPGVARTGDLVTVMRGERSEHPTPPFSHPDFVDLRSRTRSLSGLLAYHDDFVSLTGRPRPERIYAAWTSSDYFDVLGARPVTGRFFLPSEEQNAGGGPVVVISYALWQSHFGADPAIVGKGIHVNRNLCTIVGVAPRAFQGCKTGLRVDLWTTLAFSGKDLARRNDFWLNVLGKLEPGVDRRQAERELDIHMGRIAEQYPDSHRGPNQITLDPLWRSPFGANVYLYKSLPMLLALAAVLLLLACANVANLLLVRALARRREIAIRLGLGASRWQIVRQFLVETCLLALGGGALAFLFTSWSASTFEAFLPRTSTLPLSLNGHMDGVVIAATFAFSALAAGIFGILPAARSSGISPVTVLKEEAGSVSGGPGRSRLSGALVVAQICLSFLLLVCAGLFTRSLQNAQQQDPGFDPDHVLLASYELGPSGYTSDQGRVFHQRLLAGVETIPGVLGATLADFSPLSFTLHSDIAEPGGYVPHVGESMEVSRAIVAPGYFRTLKTAILSGREFDLTDTADSRRVVIVNEALADRYWPGEDPLGKTITTRGRLRTVVGVARNAKYRRLVYSPEPVFYLPLAQDYSDQVIIHVRASGDPATLASAVETRLHELNPDLPVFGVTTLRSSMQLGSIAERIAGTFAGSFGLVALVLASVGLNAVVGYTTRRRTHELGIRVAIGASRGDVLKLVLGQGVRLTAAGLAAGFLLSVLATRLLRSMLFGVTELDAMTYLGVSVLLCAVTLLASYLPARWAAKVDPIEALRHE
jgi:predicted permease